MKHTVTAYILTLILPALCLGHTVPDPRLDPPVPETTGWGEYRLDIGPFRHDGPSLKLKSDLAHFTGDQHPGPVSLKTTAAGLPCDVRQTPEDMVSMISFLWAEMFGGVDIVAEVREFAWELRSRRSHTGSIRTRREDRRSKWSLVIACRVDDQMELAARFNNRRHLFGEGSMAFQVRAVDPRTDEVGLIMSYVGGDLSLKADRVSLADVAKAKLVVKF
jgi:hypothetical protein